MQRLAGFTMSFGLEKCERIGVSKNRRGSYYSGVDEGVSLGVWAFVSAV